MVCILGVRIYDANQDALFVVPAKLESSNSSPFITDSISSKVNHLSNDEILKKSPGTKDLELTAKRIYPNSATIEDWLEIGFSESVSNRIYKYVKLKDGIERPQDLLLVYGFRKAWLDQIEDSLCFEIVRTDIQLASEDQLQLLKGIGEVYAKRIVKYRLLLGGYYSINQLLEVYGIDSVTFDMLKDQVKCSSENITLLDVNRLSYNDLRRHPYISSEIALKIVSYRSNNNIEELSELKSIMLPAKLDKIKKYLKCKN